jgi:hypothetical protein
VNRLGLGKAHVPDAGTVDDFDDDDLSATEVDDLALRKFALALVDVALVLRPTGRFDIDHVFVFHGHERSHSAMLALGPTMEHQHPWLGERAVARADLIRASKCGTGRGT